MALLTQLASWHWIFWVNVPIGIALIPLAASRLVESHGEVKRLDLPGLVLVSTGLFGLVYGLVRSQSLGWSNTRVVVSLAAGAALLIAFVWQELRTSEPMLPMEFFANRGFAVTNAVSIAMYFGMFGSIFFLSQFLQNVLHNTPLQAGVKLLVWTGAVMVVSPAAGFMSERFGSRMFMVAGLGLQAIALGMLATLASVHQTYASMIIPFVLAGSGMALVFAPSANAVLSSVRIAQTGQASGATNAIRELGGVLGIAVLATVFTSHGSYATPRPMSTAWCRRMWVGAAVLAAGALIAAVLPFSTRASAAENAAAEAGPAAIRPPPPPDPALRSELTAMATTSHQDSPRQRVPASERRDALIEAAVHEFAHGGLHGTPVDRIARRVGVAQPYVFSLFGSKRELFLAAVERGFELVGGHLHEGRGGVRSGHRSARRSTCARDGPGLRRDARLATATT